MIKRTQQTIDGMTHTRISVLGLLVYRRERHPFWPQQDHRIETVWVLGVRLYHREVIWKS